MNKIAVLGTGESLSLYDPAAFDLAIGVNDIWRYHRVDAVVVLNKPSSFGFDRIRHIRESEADAFFSQMVTWDYKRGFKKIEFYPGNPDNLCKLDGEPYERSYCSPFVACQIAYRVYSATEIHLFGVDMTRHPNLNGNILPRVVTHFSNLNKALREKGSEIIVHGNGILKNI